MSDEQNEIAVLESADPTELQLARNLLEQEGIPCRVEGGGSSALFGAVFGTPLGLVQSLLVPRECEERALEALRSAWPEDTSDEGDASGPS